MMLRIRPRVTMHSRVLFFLIGAAYIYHMVLAVEGEVYIAELMVESNVTLDTDTIQSILNETTDLNFGSTSVSIIENELIAECLIIGDETSCNCSAGYVWSNEVCYDTGDENCCREKTCNKNVSHIVPLCVRKVQVYINGSVILNGSTWVEEQTTKLITAFGKLNGFDHLNVTGQRQSNSIADFEAAISVKFSTTKAQDVVNILQKDLHAEVMIDTDGMVTIEAPDGTVCYESSPKLKCTSPEKITDATWFMNKQFERFQLNTGSVVKLNNKCTITEDTSCTEVTLENVTGMWAGTYECGFSSGSVRHTARTELKVALLPDQISLNINPLTVDCTESQKSQVHVTAIIPNSTESYKVTWIYRDGDQNKPLKEKTEGHNLAYEFDAEICCEQTDNAQNVTVIFENGQKQQKNATVNIPVIYEGKKFCDQETRDGEIWPKSPSGDTVINRTCPAGRTGFKSRTCVGSTWEEVSSFCISVELNKISNSADNFLKGLGATQEVAMGIFQGLKNSSTADGESSDATADISASINVLSVMAKASQNVELNDGVIPDFVRAASNMLNKTWIVVNDSVTHSMSLNYLQSVEDLVKNIKVNKSNGLNSDNLDLKFCTGSDCNVSVFNVSVNLNMTSGRMKTVGVKKLMYRLKNGFSSVKTEPTSFVISTTLEESNNSKVGIELSFPKEDQNYDKSFCVFWNTTLQDWSDKGCTLKTGDGNRTVCQCDHLTAFSVLMAKGSDVSNDILSIITSVGLGVSVCSLLIFLIIEFLVWSAVVKSNLSLFRHTALVNIAIFLLLGNCCFLASSSPKDLSETWCLVSTVCKHLFYLAMFSWMLCMSVMLVHQLIFVFSPLRKRVFMFISSIVGYICPILIVGCSYVYCEYTEKPYYSPDTCWLVYDRLLDGSIHAFVLPVGTVILTNVFSMVVVILTLVKSSVPDGKTDDKETIKSIIKVVVFLTPVFGVTWIIGFALLILKDGLFKDIANYSFTILNSFQGLFLLITGCFAEQRVREEVLKLIMAKSKGSSDSTKKLTSNTYSKDK